MYKKYQRKKLGPFEWIFLSLKGRWDGKRKNYKLENGAYISAFIDKDLQRYIKICATTLALHKEPLSKFKTKLAVLLDKMEIMDVELLRREEMLRARTEQIRHQQDRQEELCDLRARGEQLEITKNAYWTARRCECRDFLTEGEELHYVINSDVAVVKAYYELRRITYWEAVRKAHGNLPVAPPSTSELHAALGKPDPLEELRTLLRQVKDKIDFDT